MSTPTRGHGFKGWSRSRMAEAKGGRKIILKLIGESGAGLVSTWKHAAEQLDGTKTGKELKKKILKTAMKLHLLIEEKELTMESVQKYDISEPFNRLGVMLLHHLKRAKEERRDPATLSKAFDDAKQVSLKLLSPHMKKKNLDSVAWLFDYCKRPEFIESVLYKSSFSSTRKTLLLRLETLMGPWLAEKRKLVPPCCIPACQDLSLAVEGDFGGSKYCALHHLDMVEAHLPNPTLSSWLTDPEKRAMFGEFVHKLGSPAEVNSITFIRAAEECARIGVLERNHVNVDAAMENANTLRSRAPIIFKKHIKPSASKLVPLSDATVNALRSGIHDDPSYSIFKPAVDETHERLSVFFQKQFLPSREYRRYVESSRMPARLRRRLSRFGSRRSVSASAQSTPVAGRLSRVNSLENLSEEEGEEFSEIDMTSDSEAGC